MDKIQSSLIQQKAKGTLKRNQYIRFLHKQGENMAEIGRQLSLSRQTVRKIISEAEE